MHIINTVYGVAAGGRWQVLVDYSLWLRENGHRVTIIIDRKAKEPVTELQEHGCRIIRLANSGFYDPVASMKLWLLLQKLKPDAILSHGGRSTSLFQRAKSKNIPLIAVNHSNNVKRSTGADIFFNISEHIEQLIKYRTSKGLHFRVINCPREASVFKPREAATPIRLSFMGRLTPPKGCDILLKALARIHDRGVDFHLSIAGAGEQRTELEVLCDQLGLTDKVKFAGQVSNPIEFLANSDIFCFPTLGEGFPISPIEAFAAGCAVIGTDDPGTAELLEHGNLGVVALRGDIEAFEEALLGLIHTPQKRLELATRAQQRYLERYTPEKAKACFLQALDESIQRFASA